MAMGRNPFLKYQSSIAVRWNNLPFARRQTIVSALIIGVGVVFAVSLHSWLKATTAYVPPSVSVAATPDTEDVPLGSGDEPSVVSGPNDGEEMVTFRHDATDPATEFRSPSDRSFLRAHILGHHTEVVGWHYVQIESSFVWFYDAGIPPQGPDFAQPTPAPVPDVIYVEVPVYVPAAPAPQAPAAEPVPELSPVPAEPVTRKYADEPHPRPTNRAPQGSP